jgi:sensor histidine kinase YesM
MSIWKGKIKIPAYTRVDIWVFLIIVPFQVTICNRILLGPGYFENWRIFLVATAIYFCIMFLVFQVCGNIALRFIKTFPRLEDTAKRLILSVLCYMFITVAAITPIMWIYDKIPLLNYQMVSYTHFLVAIVCMLANIIITIVFEGIGAFERWRDTLFETEQLKKENLKSQLMSLKNQINPHFLFNSINSLSSLIADDPEKAEVFLDEMSKVYRYLLRNNEDNLIPLTMELQFINSYFHLLKTRYGDGIDLKMFVPDSCRTQKIPPLTVQILIENAVKHNVMLKEQPLKIEIICYGNKQLIVKNNVQRKMAKVNSTQVGLQNVASKYQLLNQPDIIVRENEKEFIVTVPLIENE